MKRVKNTLAIIFKIRPGEELPTLMLFILSFFTGISLVFLETSSYALFLSGFNIGDLPIVYIISAVITAIFGFIYSEIEDKFAFSGLFIFLTSVILGSLVLFYGGLIWLGPKRWIVMALIIWYSVVLTLTSLVFWSLANRLLNVRQGKRLFGVIGTGEILAGILGGFSVRFLVKLIGGASHLLVFSVGGMAGSLILLIYTMKKFRKRIRISLDEEDEANGEKEHDFFKDKYLLLILGTAALSVFGYYILDFVFYNQVEGAYVNENAIAGFLGMFIGAIGIVNLIGNAFFHSRLIERYGLSLGLLIVPVVVFLGAVASLVANIPRSAQALLLVVILTKGLDEICRTSIEEPSFKILHQPFPPSVRVRAQAAQEAITEPIASAVIGAFLLILTRFFSTNIIYPLWVLAIVTVIWIVSAILLRQEYTKALTRALAKRRLSGKALALADKSSIEVLEKGLKSNIPGEVINCLNMMEEIEHESLESFLTDLLNHPDPDVRCHVLEKIGNLGMEKAADAISARLETEEVPKVIGTALRTLCAVSETDAFELVFSYLEDPGMSPEIKRGAMAGLLQNGGIDGILSAGSKLNALLESEKSEERKLAAHVLGEVGISSFYRPLLKLLKDSDKEVRSAAITASGKLKNPRLLPLLLKNFTVPELSRVAVSAVIAFGEEILPYLESAFDEENQTRQMRIKIIRIIGRIGGRKAIEILKRKMDFWEEDIRSYVLSALVTIRYQADMEEISAIHERIRQEVNDATWTLSVIMDIGDDEDVALLIKALKSEVEKNKQRIFSLLAMIYPPKTIIQTQLNLGGQSKDHRANALEVLDNILPPDLKETIFPLIDELPWAQRHARLIRLFPQKRMNRHNRLREILERSQEWTSAWAKTCALFVVGKIAIKEFHDVVISCLSDTDDVVRETAVWALGCLNPDDLVQRLGPLKKDRCKRVAQFARFVINSVGFARIPMGSGGDLTRTGRYTADLFTNILQDSGERRLRRCRAANILARFRLTAAKSALLESLAIRDKIVRTAILDSLIKGEFILTMPEKQRLHEFLQGELEDAGRILDSIGFFIMRKNAKRLLGALEQELDYTRKRILSVLFLVCNDRKFIRSSLKPLFYWYVRKKTGDVPADVADWFSRLLPDDPGAKEKIAALFIHKQDSIQIRESWNLSGEMAPVGIEHELRQIAFESPVFSLSWSRICAIEMIVRLNLTSLVPWIIKKLQEKDDVMRATCAWALFKLDYEEYERHAPGLINDVSFLVSKTAKQLRKSKRSNANIQTVILSHEQLMA